ncbi:ABC transporter substrate-binding protein [Halalkaliarchaeum sp. AArc-GB]|uniref:ABC transporter substrate-binding protein n=1 Tax=Halalkaliarchaeum sp. AArc-GB TaxID=3074078 RepID=UPI002855A525|nr:ABC transporter substrate-binding protein [Halalkaliarchaeum sp. AArc-GB]MDR5672444.1 ABC transporter substrate-binding protein [Halalkaliarchaeum sp. AArc-GB]
MSHKTSRRTVLKGIGAAGLTAGLAGCAGAGDDHDARVGVLQPATGDLGDLGAPIQDAGVLPGLQLEDEDVPYEIEIRREDTETEPEVGIERAQALVDAGFPSVTGAASSGVTIAVAQDVFFPEEVVGISPASTSPDITDMPGDYLLRTCPTDALQGVAAATLAYEDRGLETASTFFLNNDYGQGLNDAFVENYQELGGAVYEQEAFEAEQPSYDSALEVVLGDNPDLLYVVGYPDSGEQIFRDFYENFDPDDTLVMVADGMQSNSLPGDVDNPMSNVIGTAPAAVGPGRETFDQLYNTEFGRSPGVFTSQAYDATAVHLLAQFRADELSGPAVSEQIREVANPGGEVITPSTLADGLEMAADGEEIQYHGASSEIVFDDNGDLDAATFDIFEFDIDGYTVTQQFEL